MAIAASTVTVTTSATLLFTFTNEQQTVWLAVPSGGQTVFVGGATTVTASGATGGLPLATGGAPLPIKGQVGDRIYGIVSATTQAIAVLNVAG